MKRSWPIYIAVFIGMFVLIRLASYVQTSVLDGGATVAESEEPPSAAVLISLVLVLAGIHFVAMFAATPGWRRRSLYVTRLPWGAGVALVMAAALFLLPDLAALAGRGGDETPEADDTAVVASEESVSTDTAEQPAGTDESVSSADEAEPGAEDAARSGENAGTDDESDGSKAEALTTLPQELTRLAVATAVLVVLLLVARSAGEDYWRGLGFSRRRFWRHVGTGAAAYVAFTWAVIPVAQTAILLVFELLGLPVEGHEAVEEFRETTLLNTRLALVLGITVRAPLFEEIVFRGVLFQTIKRYGGAVPAIVASAAIFAALHGALFVMINIFFLGLLFGYLFDKTGSIVPCIVLHFLFNSTTTVFLIATS